MGGLDALAEMEYPGRFIISGRSKNSDNLIIVYGITGRKSSSQARRFRQGDETLIIRTEATDEAEVSEGQRALLIYPALIPYKGMVVAGNGVQSMHLYSKLLNKMKGAGRDLTLGFDQMNPILKAAMNSAFVESEYQYDPEHDEVIDITTYEPDSNFTPRICLIASPWGSIFNIVRKAKTGDKREVKIYNYIMKQINAKGYLISTYEGENVEPLPSFRRDKLPIVELPWGNPRDAAEAVAGALKPEYAVCVVAMYVYGNSVRSSIVNKRGNTGDPN